MKKWLLLLFVSYSSLQASEQASTRMIRITGSFNALNELGLLAITQGENTVTIQILRDNTTLMSLRGLFELLKDNKVVTVNIHHTEQKVLDSLNGNDPEHMKFKKNRQRVIHHFVNKKGEKIKRTISPANQN